MRAGESQDCASATNRIVMEAMRDFFRSWRVNCPSWARELGLEREHLAISRRHERVRAAWAPHLETSRRLMLEIADRCSSRRRVLVIGAGDCLDVPVDGLAEKFAHVVLADIAVGVEARRWAKRWWPASSASLPGSG